MTPDQTADRTRARAVFSPNDFALMKEALGEHIRRLSDDDARSQRFSSLYHRLGRLG